MKKLLRSLAIGSLVITSAVVATVGYFSSNLTATGNLITTGVLQSAIDSTANTTTSIPGGTGYVVVTDYQGTVSPVAPFQTLTNVQPGETRSVWFSIRNVGSIAFDYRAYFSGSWGDNALDTQNMVSATQVHRYPADNCSGIAGCNNIYYWLTGYGNTNVATDTDFGSIGVVLPTPSGTGWFGHPNAVSNGSSTLAPNQFALFRVDFKLDENAGNDFQNKTFTYALHSYTKQLTAPTFAP